MVRKLKFHEQKLLRKTDFFTYKQDDNHRDKLVRRRYMIQKPEDYHKYNRMCGVSLAPINNTITNYSFPSIHPTDILLPP